tara:strand:+ start:8065 stop:9882 length:1818 start_codon:yes stop_codon:yes gene_type:complete
MCGFVVSLGEVNESHVKNATEAIRYRGPDETNYYIDRDKKIYVGHNRLSIMDPEFGRQPLFSDDKKIIVAYNGEIYNQFELRENLQKENVIFKSSSSDTEVVLKGYLHWGEKLFEKIDGQFAIVIIDLRRNKIIVGRDKFGEKPVFYYVDKNKIIIGSELKIFKEFKNLNYQINQIGIKKYFIYSFIPAPTTIYKNIYKVKHSEYVAINLLNRNIQKKTYYKPKIIKNFKDKDEDFVENLHLLIKESVKSRLLSDSKIGVFLSGGLDSSLISLYAKTHNSNLESYSISVDEKSFDEIDQAKKMSNFLNMKLYQTKLDQDKFNNNFSNIIKLLDEPVGAPTFVPLYFLSQLTSPHVKSVLSGDGADEIFGGYENFNYIEIFRYINLLKLNKLISKTKNVFNFIPISKNNLSLDFKLRRFCQGMEVKEKFQNTFFLSTLSLRDYEELFSEKLKFDEVLNEIEEFENEYSNVNFKDKNYLYFVNFYIPDLISARADKAGMLNSLEIRSPFLNSKILELMLTIPPNKSYLIKNKTILKKIMLKKFNYNFFSKKKGGFTYPIQKWLNASSSNLISPMNKTKFLQMREDHLNNKREFRNFFHCSEVMKNFV